MDTKRVDESGLTLLNDLALNGSRTMTRTLEFEDDLTNESPDSAFGPSCTVATYEHFFHLLLSLYL